MRKTRLPAESHGNVEILIYCGVNGRGRVDSTLKLLMKLQEVLSVKMKSSNAAAIQIM